MAIVDWLVPLAGMAMTAFIVGVVIWYKVKQAQFASPSAEYRRLAESAVENQKHLAEEARRLQQSVEDIKRLLSQVG